MHQLGINESIVNWVIDFLTGRIQLVRVCGETSGWSAVNGGVPQGTVLEPILFLIRINDIASNHDWRWKYEDDASLSEIINKGNQGNIQSVIDLIDAWCAENDMKLNCSTCKCKDLVISFAKEKPQLSPLFIQNYELTTVKSTKILGIHLSADLIKMEAAYRLYCCQGIKAVILSSTT